MGDETRPGLTELASPLMIVAWIDNMDSIFKEAAGRLWTSADVFVICLDLEQLASAHPSPCYLSRRTEELARQESAEAVVGIRNGL